MRNKIASLLSRPLIVIAVSLVIAGGIAAAYEIGGSAPEQRVAHAGPATISSADSSSASSSPRHLSLGFLASGRIQSVEVSVGDAVKKGDVLASLDPENTTGAVTQAQAAYASANAAYQKVLNGATGPSIDVAKVAVATAETALAETTTQQDTLVANARRKLYSDNLIAESDDKTRLDIAPTITGAYSGDAEGEYDLYFGDLNTFANGKVTYQGLEQGTALRSELPQAFGTRGLYAAFPDVPYKFQDRWTVRIPNKNGANYASNLNAYQSALQTRDQATAAAQAALTQARASLALTAAAARPEDVAAAQAQVENARGALQIAQAAYDSRVIRAPEDGTVSAVHVSPGQIAGANAPALELSGTGVFAEAAVAVPNGAIIERGGKKYVLVKTDGGTQEREIQTGASDAQNTEVTAGLMAGDEVLIQE